MVDALNDLKPYVGTQFAKACRPFSENITRKPGDVCFRTDSLSWRFQSLESATNCEYATEFHRTLKRLTSAL